MAKIQVFCENIDQYVVVDGGETLAAIAARIGLDFNPICALVNNKNEGLHYPVYAPKRVKFLSRESSNGTRVYVRSLCMMLYCALRRLYPEAVLKIEHTIGGGHFCRVSGVDVTDDFLRKVMAEMTALQIADLPFQMNEKPTAEVITDFERQGLRDKVLLLRTVHELYTKFYTIDGIADSYYGCLAPSTGAIDSFDLIKYEDGFILMSSRKEPIEQRKMFDAFTDYVKFNRVVGVCNVGEMNRTVRSGDARMLINVAEALQNNRIARIADEITRRYEEGGARIVLVAGPSSSGKTTFTKRLSIQLMTNLLEPQMISLDDYFVNREQTPLDEHGDYDYESLYALDLAAFERDLQALLDGEEVELPYYNFERGCREYRGNKIRLQGRSILLIEGIHGLNPELAARIEARMKFKVYVSALTTLSIDNHNWVPTTDNRLLRRIIRDNAYRGVDATETIRRWPSVRRGEEKWIFPFQENADAMFNSSLLFELGVLKERGEKLLKQVPQDCPEYAEAYRLRKFLSYFLPIDEHFIPSTSLIREFIGGSSFNY